MPAQESNVMDFKRKIAKVPVEGMGVINLKQPSAMCRAHWISYLINFQKPADEEKPSKEFLEANLRMRLEMIAACLVDDNGKPIFRDSQDAEDSIDPDLIKPIADLIEATYPLVAQDGAIKNSESDQTCSSPSNSQENSE
jgi:hypothetical protein